MLEANSRSPAANPQSEHGVEAVVGVRKGCGRDASWFHDVIHSEILALDCLQPELRIGF